MVIKIKAFITVVYCLITRKMAVLQLPVFAEKSNGTDFPNPHGYNLLQC